MKKRDRNSSVCNSATGIFPFITLNDHLCQFHAQKKLIDVKTIHIRRMQIIFYNSLQEIFPLSLLNGNSNISVITFEYHFDSEAIEIEWF